MTSVPSGSTPRELLASIRGKLPAALPTTMTAGGTKPTAGNDLYEAYIFGLVIDAARALGYQVEFETALGRATNLHLRRSPGRISSSGAPGPLFTHAALSIGTRPTLELHTGVVVAGRSKVVHEADVLLLPKSDADRCRSTSVDPGSGYARLIVEAKYYTVPVNLGTARAFLGLSKDLSAKEVAFVCTVADASSTALLAGTPSVEYDVGVLPYRNGEVSLRSFIQRLLRDYRDRR
jgi:hypothetical protein